MFSFSRFASFSVNNESLVFSALFSNHLDAIMLICPNEVRSVKGIFMGQPKRKQSKARSRLRRGAHKVTLPLLAKEADGTLVRWHHVNPDTGMYRDRQVLDVKL